MKHYVAALPVAARQAFHVLAQTKASIYSQAGWSHTMRPNSVLADLLDPLVRRDWRHCARSRTIWVCGFLDAPTHDRRTTSNCEDWKTGNHLWSWLTSTSDFANFGTSAMMESLELILDSCVKMNLHHATERDILSRYLISTACNQDAKAFLYLNHSWILKTLKESNTRITNSISSNLQFI